MRKIGKMEYFDDVKLNIEEGKKTLGKISM